MNFCTPEHIRWLSAHRVPVETCCYNCTLLPNAQMQELLAICESWNCEEEAQEGEESVRGWAERECECTNLCQSYSARNISKKRAECKGFKCIPGARDCCCRRMLFEEPDFKAVPSLVETACRARGVDVLFLPKFHG
ncbi:uncharacterized protein C8Q71DRAFT_790484 [Rhodofomes roseus]|uniref:Uncharacterized protein n=1 Tax=Rhodofomes roseus TaxID=34475 RepID=A0ABQ8JZL0_9APHY|nr:uncharacterized protein C8Q71DRAFT_790484 [Rhodofomes roseus]KAH9829489.1 hypothetical protein C8Q71DRAFT_790484 [Rhodofomes roseus]